MITLPSCEGCLVNFLMYFFYLSNCEFAGSFSLQGNILNSKSVSLSFNCSLSRFCFIISYCCDKLWGLFKRFFGWFYFLFPAVKSLDLLGCSKYLKFKNISLSLFLFIYVVLIYFYCFSSNTSDLGFALVFKMTQVGGVLPLGIEQLVEGKCEAALLFKVDRVFFHMLCTMSMVVNGWRKWSQWIWLSSTDLWVWFLSLNELLFFLRFWFWLSDLSTFVFSRVPAS